MEKYFYLAAAILLMIFIFILYQRKKRKKGRAGELKTAAVLKKFAKQNTCMVINGIWLPLYKGTCEVDHIVFGNFGIAVIETKAVSGRISGSGKYLTQTIGKRRHRLYNPNLQNKTHMDNIRHHLLKAGFRDVPIFGFTVFTEEDIIIHSPGLGVKLSALYGRLEALPCQKYDYRGMYEAILRVRVRSPLKKLLHNIRH